MWAANTEPTKVYTKVTINLIITSQMCIKVIKASRELSRTINGSILFVYLKLMLNALKSAL